MTLLDIIRLSVNPYDFDVITLDKNGEADLLLCPAGDNDCKPYYFWKVESIDFDQKTVYIYNP